MSGLPPVRTILSVDDALFTEEECQLETALFSDVPVARPAPKPAPVIEQPKIVFIPTPEQKTALDLVEKVVSGTSDCDLIALTGAAGTGKTASMRALTEVVSKSNKSVAWAAMTGKAAQRLAALTGVGASTLHATLYQPPKVDWDTMEFDDLRDPTCDILVVDEASMMTPKTYDDVQTWSERGVKIVLVGDYFQLSPIISKKEEERYGKDFSVFAYVDGPMLTRIMRNDNEIAQAGAFIREKGHLPRESKGAYQFVVANDPLQYAVDSYLEDPDDHLLITWRNDARMEANRRIRAAKGFKTILARGEPIIFRRNSRGFLNGDIGFVETCEMGPTFGPIRTLRISVSDFPERHPLVSFQGNKEVMDGAPPYIEDRKQWHKYQGDLKKHQQPEPIPITYGYCYTAHLAQGSEARRTTVFLNKEDVRSFPFLQMTSMPKGKKVAFGSRWIYTAITRAKQQVTFVTSP